MSGANDPCIVKGICASPTDLPEFIDTSACLCGLLTSKQADPNGGLNQLWRCIGNASANLNEGENGKWYNTTLPSQELSGINQPQNWGENGPDTSQAFVVVNNNGNLIYEKLGPKGSPSLIGADSGCTGKNDTQLSTTFYSHSGSNGTSAGTTASPSILSASATSSVSASMSSASGVASSTASSTAASGTASSTASPSNPKVSEASHGSVKAIILVGMLLAPLVTLMA